MPEKACWFDSSPGHEVYVSEESVVLLIGGVTVWPCQGSPTEERPTNLVINGAATKNDRNPTSVPTTESIA